MTRPVIVDSGPLVALLNRTDRWHRWATEQLEAIDTSLLTCEAVLTETTHLLRHDPRGPDAVLQLVSRGLLKIDFSLQSHADDLRKLMWRYRDQPMSLADACLVVLSERIGGCRVFTLDSHFRHYRRRGRQVIPLLAPGF